MAHRRHKGLTGISVRHRERLMGVIAATTLMLGWYVSAALDARPYPQQTRRTAISDFDAAFLAANTGPVIEQLPCSGADCPSRLVQANEPRAVVGQNAEIPVSSRPTVSWCTVSAPS
jgi:hypothetical protein